MGFIQSLKAQFLPLQHDADINTMSDLDKSNSDPHLTAPELFKDTIEEPKSSVQVRDITLYRNGALGSGLETRGIAKVEAAKAVWGKNGRYLIIARYLDSGLSSVNKC